MLVAEIRLGPRRAQENRQRLVDNWDGRKYVNDSFSVLMLPLG